MKLAPPGDAPIASHDGVVEHGTTERLWRVTLPDGRAAVLGELLPELAALDVVRSRYRADVERVAAAALPAVAPVIAVGDTWRLRLQPEGETLEAWIARSAPAAIEATTDRFVALLEALATLHERGFVARELDPRRVIIAPDGRAILTDVGLARLGLLTTRTASSLVLGRSPYASPEQLARNVVDGRSDLFSVGVMMWRALTGAPPFGARGLLDPLPAAPPELKAVRPDVPPHLAALLLRCLAPTPDERPATARAAIALARAPTSALMPLRTSCQACGAALWDAQRLCIRCGHEAVQLVQSDTLRRDQRWAVDLLSASDDADQIAAAERYLGGIAAPSEGPIELDVAGHGALFSSDAERNRTVSLPLRIAVSLDRRSAERIASDLAAMGFEARATPEVLRWYQTPALEFAAVVGWVGLLVIQPVIAAIAGAGLLALSSGTRRFLGSWLLTGSLPRGPSHLLLDLRAAPAALPASDPWVRRLAEHVTPQTAPDIADQIGRMALAVQRLVDRRGALVDQTAQADVDRAAELVGPLVERISEQLAAVQQIDRALADLDEGLLLRGLAAYTRAEDRERRAAILAALERIRALEDDRIARFAKLLRAGELVERAVAVGLAVEDAELESARCLEAARAELGLASGTAR